MSSSDRCLEDELSAPIRPSKSSAFCCYLDKDGNITMVDVGAKPDTQRVAIAEAIVELSPNTLKLLAAGACRAGRERKMAGRKFFCKKYLPGRGKSATYISAPKWWNW